MPPEATTDAINRTRSGATRISKPSSLVLLRSKWSRHALVPEGPCLATSKRHEDVPSLRYRNRSTGAGVLSSSGVGVALGSASGFGAAGSFFFFFAGVLSASGRLST